jgi:flagellar motor switch protein FliG
MSKGPKIGVPGALEILEGLEPAIRDRIMNEIQERQPDLFEQLQKGLLNIESLLKLEDSELRTLLQEIPREKWARSMRACSDELKQRLLANLPARARSELEELIVSIGPQPLSEVRRLQSEIALVARTRFQKTRSEG